MMTGNGREIVLAYERAGFRSTEKVILQDVDLAIQAGDYLAIAGPSGSGKSTLLRLAAHLVSPTSGRIRFRGQDLMTLEPTTLRMKVGYCFQKPHLFGHTVADNLAFPFEIRRLAPDETRMRALLRQFNLEETLLAAPVLHLSGGEQQRIALVRSLLFPPEVLLLDEVTAALDRDNTRKVTDAIRDLNQEGLTVLWVTHQLDQISGDINRLVRVEDGLVSVEEAHK